MTNNQPGKIMIIAGEASGDMHGANLVKALKKARDDLFIFGFGGHNMEAAGARIVFDAHKLSVVGITEVFAKAPVILKGRWVAKQLLSEIKPDLLILIDFPDFNLHIAGIAKKYRIPVLYYISPQIWAWRQKRVLKIKQLVKHMAVILPFEADFYKKYNVPVSFVGHPLMDNYDGKPHTLKEQSKLRYPVVGLVPGSRKGEVKRHLPIMLEAAQQIKAQNPQAQFQLSCAPSVDQTIYNEILAESSFKQVKQVSGGATRIFHTSSLVLAVSGTVTLEAAIFNTPLVVMYCISPISYTLGRFLISVSHIGLVNLIAGKTVAPELIQHQVTPARISQLVKAMIEDQSWLNAIKKELSKVQTKLGAPGASDRTAAIALEMMAK